MSSQIKIIIDTNLWISFLITKNFNGLDKLLLVQRCKLLFSDELLAEFLEVTERPKFKKYFSNNDINNIIDIISEYADYIDVSSEINFLEDSKDDFLLELAFDGEADYLITGDKQLLEIKKYGNTLIVSFTEFMELVRIENL